jgi:hypothetical protein
MGVDRMPRRILERLSLETQENDAGSDQEDTQPFPLSGALLQKNSGKNAYQQETQHIHRYDVRPVSHLQGAEGADPRSTRGKPGQHPEEPSLRSEREEVTLFARRNTLLPPGRECLQGTSLPRPSRQKSRRETGS